MIALSTMYPKAKHIKRKNEMGKKVVLNNLHRLWPFYGRRFLYTF